MSGSRNGDTGRREVCGIKWEWQGEKEARTDARSPAQNLSFCEWNWPKYQLSCCVKCQKQHNTAFPAKFMFDNL